MSWNYRVMQYEDAVGIVEAYYDKETGEVSGYTNPIVVGNDMDDLIGTLELMRTAADKAKVGEPLLDCADKGKYEAHVVRLQKELENCCDHYVTMLANANPEMDINEIYEFAEVVKWYRMADKKPSAKAKQED